MSTERNKQAVMTYLTALAHNDVKGMSAVMTDDATWWIAPGTKFSGLHQKADVLANISVLYQNATGGLKLDICDVTAEADRVNVVAKGDLPLKDGRAYQTNYSILFRMRDGKIASGKEFLDAIHVNEIFGAP